MATLGLTREHFQTLYGNLPVDAWVYDSAQISRLRQFAGSNQMQVLVINIDAFNKKDISIIGKDLDGMSGRKPIEFIQSTNPIVIIDEPQNMESDKAREALASLNPGIPAAAPRAAFDTMLHLGQAGADALDTPCENEAHSQSWKKVLSSA